MSGLLPIIGDIFSPVTRFFELPGAAATVLIADWMSIGGCVAAAFLDQRQSPSYAGTSLAPEARAFRFWWRFVNALSQC